MNQELETEKREKDMETLVPGLRLYRDFMSEAKDEELINQIDARPWMVDYEKL